MHGFNERFLLREAARKMRENEARAATDDALRELRRSQPSAKQLLAATLVGLATRLEPSRYPVYNERKGTSFRNNVRQR